MKASPGTVGELYANSRNSTVKKGGVADCARK